MMLRHLHMAPYKKVAEVYNLGDHEWSPNWASLGSTGLDSADTLDSNGFTNTV